MYLLCVLRSFVCVLAGYVVSFLSCIDGGVYTYIEVSVLACVCVRECVCTHFYVHVNVCTFLCVVCASVFVYAHIHMCVYMYASKCFKLFIHFHIKHSG